MGTRFISKGAEPDIRERFQCFQCKAKFKKGDKIITEAGYEDKAAVFTIYTYHLECV